MARGGGISLLMIDDDVDSTESVRETLADRGYAVAIAHDVTHALRFLYRSDALPALIFLDAMVQGLDPYQFRRVLKYDQDLATIPLVLLSAAGKLDEMAAALDAEAFLRKPIDSDALMKLVERYCGAPSRYRVKNG